MNKDEALRLALDKKADNARDLGLNYDPENTLHWHALNYRTAPTQNAQKMFEALEKFVETAIKQALEQPAPYRAVKTYHDGKPVYVQEPPKREWQGLTDVDVSKILDEQNGFYTFEKCFNFAKAIEAKLKDRNT